MLQNGKLTNTDSLNFLTLASVAVIIRARVFD
jgi:hypothetical protein